MRRYGGGVVAVRGLGVSDIDPWRGLKPPEFKVIEVHKRDNLTYSSRLRDCGSPAPQGPFRRSQPIYRYHSHVL